MMHRRITRYTLLTFITLLLLLFIAACGVSAYQQVPRQGNIPAEREAVRAIVQDVVTQTVAAQLTRLSQSGVTLWSATITPTTNTAGNVIWTRATGETAAGTIANETDNANPRRLLKIQLTTAAGDLTITTPGPASNFTGKTLRIGDNYLDFQSNADTSTYSTTTKETDWTFTGNYAAWYQTGAAYTVAILKPIAPSNLLPAPIPAAATIPDHFLGYDDDVNQVPLTLLDDRYRRRTPATARELPTFPANPAPGQSVILLHSQTVRQYYTGTVTQSQTTLREIPVNINIPGGRIVSIQGYSPSLNNPDTTLRDKVFVITNGSPTSLPLSLDYKGIPRSINQTIHPGDQRFYQVPALTYADLVPNEKTRYAFTLADGTVLPAHRRYRPDAYTYNGTTWELTPGSVSLWAEADNSDKIPLSKLPAAAVQILHAKPGTSLIVNDTSQTRRAALTTFAPAFDLTAANQSLGIITFRAQLRFANRSPGTNIGFDQNTANPLQYTTLEGFAYANAVKQSDPYNAAAVRGVKIAATPIYNGATTLGTLSLYAARDSNHNLGYYLNYDGAGGNYHFNLDHLDLEAGFIPNDQPPKAQLKGRHLATYTLPAAGGTPTSNQKLGIPTIASGVTDITIAQPDGLNFSAFSPSENCFALMMEATINGTVYRPSRAFLLLGPGGVDLDEGQTGGRFSDPAIAAIKLAQSGNSVLVKLTYDPMYGTFVNIISDQYLVNPDTWSSYPANVVITFTKRLSALLNNCGHSALTQERSPPSATIPIHSVSNLQTPRRR